MKPVFYTVFALVVFAAAAYGLLIYYDNAFIYGRMRETPAIRPHEIPLPVMTAGVVPYSDGDMYYQVRSPEAVRAPIDLNEPEIVQRGRTVYATFCVQCHGRNHDGNGTVGQSFQPLPTDLRSPAVQAASAGRLFWEISYGIPGGRGRQPALASTVGLMNRWYVVAYVKALDPRGKRP